MKIVNFGETTGKITNQVMFLSVKLLVNGAWYFSITSKVNHL